MITVKDRISLTRRFQSAICVPCAAVGVWYPRLHGILICYFTPPMAGYLCQHVGVLLVLRMYVCTYVPSPLSTGVSEYIIATEYYGGL